MLQAALTTVERFNTDAISNYFKKIKNDWIRHRNYKNTVKELSALSDKELNDIGMNRGIIHSIAMETSYDDLEVNENMRGWS